MLHFHIQFAFWPLHVTLPTVVDRQHRDLAARNVLVDKTMTCRIGDFGLSVDLAGAEQEEAGLYSGMGNNKVPIRWTAIEVLP